MMRRLYLLILLAVLWLLPSCKKDGPQQGELKLFVSAESSEVKTTLGEKDAMNRYSVYWSEGDIISINGELSRPLTRAGAGASSTLFTFPSRPSEADSYQVIYPGNASGKVVFPTVQTFLDGSFCPGAAPLLARIATLDDGVSLKSCAVAIRFTLKGDVTLLSMDVNAIGGEKISGEFTPGDGLALIPSSAASAAMTFSFGEGVSLGSNGRNIVFTIPGGTYSKGVKALIHAADGTTMALAFVPRGGVLAPSTVCMFPESAYLPGKEIFFNSADALVGEVTDLEETGTLTDMEAEPAQASVSLKVGSYNIWAPSARKSVMDADESVPAQRSWANSYISVADMIKQMDCDVLGIQEVTRMVYQTTLTSGNEDYDGNVHTLNNLLPDYSWVIYNAANTTYDGLFPTNTTAAGLGSTDAILYKTSVLTLVSQGRYWLTGTRKVAPGDDSHWDHIGTNRPATWAKFTHKASGKQFIFVTTHLDLPNAGQESDPGMPQLRNATELIDWMLPLVAPESLPSVFCGDMNCDGSNEAYAKLKSSRWTDVFETMAADGALSSVDARVYGTMPANKNEEGGLTTWRPDHIFTYGCTPSYYRVMREKLPTRDGSPHWPSDHLPVKVIVNF